MFEKLADYRAIVVTGPQRSGTHIAAKMIALDTLHEYVDETAFDVHNEKRFLEIVRTRKQVVVQAPGMAHMAEKLPDDVLVVFMWRSLTDIHASEKRIGWTAEHRELPHYDGYGGPAAERKYKHWEKQKADIMYWMELEYEDLSAHPLWVPKDRRQGFAATQTKETTDES